MISIVTDPVIRAARWITPRMVMDRHIPVVAFVLLPWIWLPIVFWVLPEMCGSGRYDCSALLERKRGELAARYWWARTLDIAAQPVLGALCSAPAKPVSAGTSRAREAWTCSPSW